MLESAHDVSDGGLAVALAECCTVGGAPGVGAEVELPREDSELDALATLFGEGPSRIVVSVRPAVAADLLERAAAARVPAIRIGATGGGALSIAAPPLGALSVGVAELRARRDACLTPIVGD